MSREMKWIAVWAVVMQGGLIALGTYLAGALLTALLLVRGAVPEEGLLLITAAMCVIAVWLGGSFAGKRTALGRLPTALLTAAMFGAVLLLAGVLFWHSIAWQGSGGILLVCALLGGCLAGLTVRPKRRKKKRGRSGRSGK